MVPRCLYPCVSLQVVQLRFPGVLPVEPLKVDYTSARDVSELEEDFAELMKSVRDSGKTELSFLLNNVRLLSPCSTTYVA